MISKPKEKLIESTNKHCCAKGKWLVKKHARFICIKHKLGKSQSKSIASYVFK